MDAGIAKLETIIVMDSEAMKATPDKRILDEAILYDPETGKLEWRVRPVSAFSRSVKQSPDHTAKIWNAKNAGKPAFVTVDRHGHRYTNLDGVRLYAHRAIWKMMTGEEPNVIDHINGDPSDNRFVNIRSVGQKLNTRNQKLRNTNKTGYNGVYWSNKRHKFAASITVDGKTKFLGYYPTAEMAFAVRQSVNAANGFHENHGRHPAALPNDSITEN